jgi:hypothetical protein
MAKTKRSKPERSNNSKRLKGKSLERSSKRGKRSKTPSFVAEIPLQTTSADRRTLDIRLDACRNIYNAVLQVMLTLLHKMRQDPEWRIAVNMPNKTEEEQEVRNAAFQAVKDRYGGRQRSFSK